MFQFQYGQRRWRAANKGEDKERRDGFIENFYDLISGISDLIVQIIAHIIRLISIHKKCNCSAYRFQISHSVSSFATPEKRNMQSIERFQTKLSESCHVLKSCRENNDTRLGLFLKSILDHQPYQLSKSLCFHLMANNRSLISAQKKCHMACASSQKKQ